ncbi:hypothetical protein ACFYU8_18615 [Brevibacillus sp. NPDC003359]|uniref:hypothetical protein n=1 Tax=unclassified Brevibacillus TaxID=2684853 RepID=UPI0036760E5F
MIKSEFIRRAMLDMSGTEIDFYLYLFRVVDWDGNIRATIEELAACSQTSVLYARNLIKKGIAKGLLERDPYDHDLIRFTFASTDVEFDRFSAQYSKKYTFLYTDTFRSLCVNAKRMLLMAAFRMSVNGTNYVIFDKNEIYQRSAKIINYLLPLDDTKYQMAISDIQDKIGEIVQVYQVCDRLSKKPQLHFSFNSSVFTQYHENHTELYLLQRTITLNGIGAVLDRAHCIEMLKTAKHLLRVVPNRRLARAIYRQSVDMMVSFTRSEGEKTPSAASAYFSKIIHENMKAEMLKASQQIEYIEELRGNFNLILQNKQQHHSWMQDVETISICTPEYEERIQGNREIIKTLMVACEKWFSSRVQTERSTEKSKAGVSERLQTMVHQDLESFYQIESQIQPYLVGAAIGYEVKKTIADYRQFLLTYLYQHNDENIG